MKYIKTVAMSLLLANSFSSNEVTWKEIETEIKPHIKEVESDFSALTKNISEIYKQYRETTKTATDFDDFGDYFTEKEKEGKKVRDENVLKGNRERNKAAVENNKIQKEKEKKQEKEHRKKFITEIKNNITDILSTDKEITIDEKEITSNKEILQGIDKILNIIKKTYSIITNFNNLKTFSDIDEFTKNYNELINFLKKYQKKNKKDKLDLEEFTTNIFFYTLIFSAIKENKAEILEFFGFPKNIITKIKEKEKIELKDTVITNIAHTVDNYILNLNTILYTNQTKFDEFIAKNKINEYVLKEKNLEKETYNKKVFKNKSLNNMTIFEALSSAKNKEIVKTESPTILAILEKFKGTEEENKKMTVRRAINIIIDFTELSFLGKTEINTNEISEAKKEKRENGFNKKQNSRIQKLEEQIKKLEEQKEKSISEEDKKILDKEINALKKTIEKITQERLKEQTYIDEATNNEEKSPAERVQARTTLAEKKIAAKGQAKKESAEEKSNKGNSYNTSKEKTDRKTKSTRQKTRFQNNKRSINSVKGAAANFNIIDESDTKEKREKEIQEKKLKRQQNLEKFNKAVSKDKTDYKAYDNKESSGSNILTKEELAEAKRLTKDV